MRLRGLMMTCVLAFALTGCTTRQPARFLFVVPEQLPSGADSTAQRAELESWLVSRAGGFTEIEGVRGGWMAPDGAVVTERNRLYLVTVPKNGASFRADLNNRIVEDFDQQEAWIERW
jgi:hypothetical protein